MDAVQALQPKISAVSCYVSTLGYVRIDYGQVYLINLTSTRCVLGASLFTSAELGYFAYLNRSTC